MNSRFSTAHLVSCFLLGAVLCLGLRDSPVLLGISLTLGLFLALSNYLYFSLIARSLQELALAAARIGKVQGSTRLAVETGSAVGELAGVLNEVAVRIEGEFARIKGERNRLNAILRGIGEGIMVADASGCITRRGGCRSGERL